jgi:PPK2 family polyphosphate:nucleotide phosphotransferase
MSTHFLDAFRSPYLVPFDGSFEARRAATTPPAGGDDKKKNRKDLRKAVSKLARLQHQLYADDRFAVLLVFQALDAAGKDGTIRAVLSGVNPAGCQVFSFKQPSSEELDHDFLWRCYRRLPERGRIGVFNRSHYEEVLVVRVHPEYLGSQKLPRLPEAGDLEALWAERYESINDFERHLARNGTVILKFWLNVSRDEQRKRFLDRIDQPESNWKFAPGDVRERRHWDRYIEAYEDALRATSRPWAPWYAIPADDKPFMRLQVAEIVVATLKQLGVAYPEVSDARRAEMLEMRRELEGD